MSYDISLYDVIAIFLSILSIIISFVIYYKSLFHLKIYVSKALYLCSKRRNPINGGNSKYWGYVEATLINNSSNPISVHRITIENIDYKFSEKFQTAIACSENNENNENKGYPKFGINPDGAAVKLPVYIQPYSSIKLSLAFEDISLIVNENDCQSEIDDSGEDEKRFKKKAKTYKLIYPNDGTLNLILYTSRKKIKSSISFRCIK